MDDLKPNSKEAQKFKYDVFLSHSSKDKIAVRDLAERLRADGIRVWLDEWVIQPGDIIGLKIEQGLEESGVLMLAMSENAFASEWTTLERHTALFRDPTNIERRFIPLLIEDCQIKDALKQFLYLDWRLRNAEQYSRILSILRSRTQIYRPDADSLSMSAEIAKTKSRRNIDKKNSETHISINYARLFGAYQIPFLFGIESRGLAVNPQVNRFAKNWEYISAKAVRSTVWEELYSLHNGGNLQQTLLQIVNKNDPLGRRFFDIDINLRQVADFYLLHPELMPDEFGLRFLKQTYDEFMSLFAVHMQVKISEIIQAYWMISYSETNSDKFTEKDKWFILRDILDVPNDSHPLYDPEGFMFTIRNDKEKIIEEENRIKHLQKIKDELKALAGASVVNRFREKIIKFQEEHPEIYTRYFFSGDELEYFSSRPHGDYAFCEIATQSSYKPREVLERVKFNSDKTGFLILFLENIFGSRLQNINITYKELLRKDSFETSINAEQAEKLLIKEKVRRKTLPYLEPGEKILWLLSIYYKDEKGFPEDYLSSVTRPLTIEYNLDGNEERFLMKIRKPLMEKAMKVSVPFGWGWYYQ